MAPRAYWKGYLRLSLVTCPIELYPATSQSEKAHFHQINRKTGHRLRQQMVDEETGKVVEKEEKGRGYELSKGKYVEIDEEELEAVEIESTHTINIDNFVPAAEIDKRYLDKPYYVAPSGKSAVEAFAVIRDALKHKDRVALARIVMAHREHIIALEPLGNGLLATTLRYDYEVRDEKDYFADIPNIRISKDMVKLGEHILETKEAHFDPRKFKDEYEIALKKLVHKKAAGRTIEAPAPEEKPSNVINLMDALRRSVEGDRKQSSRAGHAKKRRPASTKRQKRSAA
jgi:Ku protein